MQKKIVILFLILAFITACSCSKKSNKDVVDDKYYENFDPYEEKNVYELDDSIVYKQDDVHYGRIDEDVKYYSKIAGDYKTCNVVLPYGYDENTKYPVMYFIHGWGASYKDHFSEESYLHLLHGNMIAKNLAVPMIVVAVDMYTGKQAERDKKSDEALRFLYDNVVDDIALDLMPYIEEHYSVKTGRENNAIIGVSQGGAESLITGFKYLDKFGYIAGIAPDTGVIPTEWYKGTFWNTPYFEEFPMPTEDNMPIYLYMAVGSDDPWNVDCTLYYSEVLNKMGVKNQTDLVEGFGHDAGFWRLGVYNFMHKIFR